MTLEVTGPKTTRQDPAITRARLLDVALELFLVHGYEDTSVRALASAAGVTTGAFHGHFETKRSALLEAVALMTTSPRRDLGRRRESEANALILTVASFAHDDDDAARVLSNALAALHPGSGDTVDRTAFADLIVRAAER